MNDTTSVFERTIPFCENTAEFLGQQLAHRFTTDEDLSSLVKSPSGCNKESTQEYTQEYTQGFGARIGADISKAVLGGTLFYVFSKEWGIDYYRSKHRYAPQSVYARSAMLGTAMIGVRLLPRLLPWYPDTHDDVAIEAGSAFTEGFVSYFIPCVLKLASKRIPILANNPTLNHTLIGAFDYGMTAAVYGGVEQWAVEHTRTKNNDDQSIDWLSIAERGVKYAVFPSLIGAALLVISQRRHH